MRLRAIRDTFPDSDGEGVVDLCPGTVLGATVDSDGCPPTIVGDFDRDGDVDSYDLTVFVTCVSGPAMPCSSGCANADVDTDGDVDQCDFGVFQRCHSGTGKPAGPSCAD